MKALGAILAAQAALFVALPWTGSEQSWGVFCSFNAEIADAFFTGVSPWDEYDGLVAGPMAMALLEGPFLAVLGRSPWVHTLTTLTISLSATGLTFFAVRRLATPRAAVLAAALVAFPPPNTWYHQHQGAYHLLGLLGMPIALLLLSGAGPRVRWGREIAGWTALAGGLALAPGGIGPAAAIGVGLLWLRYRAHPRAAALGLAPAAIGAAIASFPLVYKARLHTPFEGFATVGSKAVAGQTKPFFLGVPKPTELPGRLWTMLTSDLPYGMHFDSAGVPIVGGLFVVLAGLAFVALLGRVRSDERARRLLPVILVPVGAVGVGLLTGWFVVGRTLGQEPFPRDARHLLVITFFLAWLLGLALDRLRWPAVAPIVVAGLALASIGTQAHALGESRGVPFRLQSRYIQGFFVGPMLVGQPEGAVAWCSEGPDRLDCLRGVAMSWGHRFGVGDYGLQGRDPSGGPSRTPARLRGECRALGRAADETRGDLRDACFFGLGFGFSHQATRRLDRAVETCHQLALRDHEHRACARGAAWAQAQNFWNRRGAVQRWVDEQVQGQDRLDSASGVGILVAMLADDPTWQAQQCANLVPADVVSACLEGAESNRRFMPSEDR